ncbi:ABC transporter permease [Microbacterium elymi]|uniref:Transport permease protein n=1 Tax=Microbacterium elymi TaxID=2909587 RepID=A0ABY5NGP9_9MICO|nr:MULTISPECIES: ABC transporter permease [Microbacterium]UUT34330.1 ABC transporter permease [Microbacterium elymi]
MTVTATPQGRVSLERKVPPLGGFNLRFLGLELKRRFRNYRTLVFTVIFPVAMYFMVGYPQRNTPLIDGHPIDQGGLSVAAYLMVSMAVYGAMMSATASGAAVAVERSLGWSRQLRLTPLSPVAAVATKVVGGMVFGLVAIVATYLAGAFTGVHMSGSQWIVSALVAWLLGSAVFTTLGLMMGYLVPGENAMQLTSLVIVFLAFIGGLFYPVSMMPPVLQDVAAWTPVFGIGELSRAPLTGEGFDLGALLNVLLWLGLFIVGTALLFRRDTKRV